MDKNTFYFSHDYNARNDDKILQLRSKFGVRGYGLFWMVIETMAENKKGSLMGGLMRGLSKNYGVSEKELTEFLDYCVQIKLFTRLRNNYFSKRLLSHKKYRKMLSERGKEGADKRWG